jgi:DNA-binding transcriptional LysR family regulator
MLQSAPLSLVLPPEHPWQDITVQLADLRGQPFLLRSPGSQTRRMTEALLRSANLGLSDLQVVAEFDSSEGVIMAVQAGLGVGFANSTIATRYAAHHQISLARLHLGDNELTSGDELCHEIYLSQLATLATNEHPPSQKLFWDFLRSQQEFYSP